MSDKNEIIPTPANQVSTATHAKTKPQIQDKIKTSRPFALRRTVAEGDPNQINFIDNLGIQDREIAKRSNTTNKINLTLNESMALHAMQVLMQNQDFIKAYKTETFGDCTIQIPIIYCTHQNIYERSGLIPVKKGGNEYGGQARNNIDNGIKSLCERKHYIEYDEKHVGTNGKSTTLRIKELAELIKIYDWEEKNGNSKGIKIALHPMLIYLEEFVYKDLDHYGRLRKSLAKGERLTAVQDDFFTYLFTQASYKESKFRISRDKLARKVGLSNKLKSRKQKQLDEQLIKLFEQAKRDGILKTWKREVSKSLPGEVVFEFEIDINKYLPSSHVSQNQLT